MNMTVDQDHGPCHAVVPGCALGIDADLLALALRTNLAVSSSMHSLAVVPMAQGSRTQLSVLPGFSEPHAVCGQRLLIPEVGRSEEAVGPLHGLTIGNGHVIGDSPMKASIPCKRLEVLVAMSIDTRARWISIVCCSR